MDSQLLSSIASEAAEATNVPVSEPAGRRAVMGCDYQNIRASKGKRGTELLQAGRSSGQYRTQGRTTCGVYRWAKLVAVAVYLGEPAAPFAERAGERTRRQMLVLPATTREVLSFLQVSCECISS